MLIELFFYKKGANKSLKAATDCPCANFSEELIHAYPNAKVILTTREHDSWLKSMESCYYQIIEKLPCNPVVYLEPNDWGSFLKLLRVILIEISGSTDWKDVQLCVKDSWITMKACGPRSPKKNS